MNCIFSVFTLSINILLAPLFFRAFPEASASPPSAGFPSMVLAPCPRHSSNGRCAPVMWRHLRSRSYASVAASNHSLLVNRAEKSNICCVLRHYLFVFESINKQIPLIIHWSEYKLSSNLTAASDYSNIFWDALGLEHSRNPNGFQGDELPLSSALWFRKRQRYVHVYYASDSFFADEGKS